MSPIAYPLTRYTRILFSLARPRNAVISSLLIYKLADRFINSSLLFFTLPFLFFFSFFSNCIERKSRNHLQSRLKFPTGTLSSLVSDSCLFPRLSAILSNLIYKLN